MSTKHIIVPVAAALLLVACGQNSDETSSSATAPPVTNSPGSPEIPAEPEPLTTNAPLLGAEADASSFAQSLYLYASGDPVYPTSMANVFELYDVVAVGTITNVVDGRQEFLGTDGETGEPIVARYVNIEVSPTDFIQGETLTPDQPLSLERPWPTNLAIDELVKTLPLGQRVLVLGSYQDMEFVNKTSGPLIESGAIKPETIAANLVTFPSFGLIIEDGTSAITIEDGNIFDFAAAEFGVQIDGFGGAIQLLREAAPQE